MNAFKINLNVTLPLTSLALLLSAQPLFAKEKILHSFADSSRYLFGELVEDHTGSLYGTIFNLADDGSVYQLKKKSGGWTFKSLHDFDDVDGSDPSAGLTESDADRVFYGVTAHGGVHDAGTVFSIAPQGHAWIETVIHSFSGSTDGLIPSAPLLFERSSGRLFGTTEAGGQKSCGTAFQLGLSGGDWTLSTIYNFQGDVDGCSPITQMQEGPEAGTLIGSTYEGGASNTGTIFELAYSNGVWTKTIIHDFSGGLDGGVPYDLVKGKGGTIFGVANTGGMFGAGVVFELKPHHGTWRFKVLYSFGGLDGANPTGLCFEGNTESLYGVTKNGGDSTRGIVFQLVPNGTHWTETVVHSFKGGNDGAYPEARPLVDSDTGEVYGTTLAGGTFDSGTVYAITP